MERQALTVIICCFLSAAELRGTSQQKRVYRSSGAQAPPLPVKSFNCGGGVTSMAPGTWKRALNELPFHQSIRKKKPNYTKFPHHTEDISPMGSQSSESDEIRSKCRNSCLCEWGWKSTPPFGSSNWKTFTKPPCEYHIGTQNVYLGRYDVLSRPSPDDDRHFWLVLKNTYLIFIQMIHKAGKGQWTDKEPLL